LFYIYEHIRPDTNAIFYVGKGSGNRCNITQHRNPYWKNIVAKAGGFIVNKIAENLDSELAYLAEQERIDQLKRLGVKLCNLTNGGDGLENPSKETRKKMSNNRLGNKNPRFNMDSIRQKRLRGELKVPKEVMVANMKANHWSKTGKYIPLKGIKRSEEVKLKLKLNQPSRANGNNPKAKVIIYNNQEFLCIKDFANFLNVNYKTLVQKIRAVKRTVFTTEDFDSLTNGRIAF
jgi:hypothetical protein